MLTVIVLLVIASLAGTVYAMMHAYELPADYQF